ncbi:MAG: hypothetical protein LBF97_05755 [Elusimicrobiota bacterium]|jgi:hypothetical protein|nr:hypothetical protein [Elusimicrobiota bacterium]
MNAQDSEKMGMYDFYIRSQEKLKSNFYTFEGDAIIFPGEGIFLPH